MRKLMILLVLAIAIPAFAYHEFQVPGKAYKKVTVEYYSNEFRQVRPDSTVTIYYDQYQYDCLVPEWRYREIGREIKRGSGSDLDLNDPWPSEKIERYLKQFSEGKITAKEFQRYLGDLIWLEAAKANLRELKAGTK